MRKHDVAREKWAKGTTLIMLLGGIIFSMPMLILVMNSFKPYSDMIQNFIALPKTWTLENYAIAIERIDFFNVLGNSFIVTVGAVVISIFFSFIGAYGITHVRREQSKFLYLFFTMGQIIPYHSIMIAMQIMATKLGINNSLTGLIGLYVGFHCSFGVFTYVGFLKSIPRELEEAAYIDGCGPFRTMVQIIFPLLRPATITTAVLFFLWTWNDFLLPSLMISDSSKRLLTVAVFMIKGTAYSEWNLLIAALVLSCLPVLVLYILAQKYITSGITAGSVKM